jgi:hypothetical protein
MSVRRTSRFAAFVLAASLVGGEAVAQLSGLYTIHPQRPVSATNFQNLYSATTALATSGVSGPVVFELYDDAGPFVDPMTFYSANHPVYGTNLSLGNGICVLRLAQWAGVSPTNRVTFRAAPGERPVLDATGKACVVYGNGADYVTLEGLELRNAVFDAVNFYTASAQNALGNHVVRCVLRDCGGCGVVVYGNSGAVNDTVIAGNVFSNCMQVGGGTFGTTARFGYVCGRRDNNTQVLFNTFLVGTLAGGTSTVPSCVVGDYPSSTSYTAITKFEGNIVVKTATAGVVFHFQTSSATVAPTIPTSSEFNDYWLPGGGNFAHAATVPYATLAAWQTTFSRDLTSLTLDPMLTGPALPPRHLPSGSPFIGYGPTTYPTLATHDVDGHPRDAFPDVGADEYAGDPAAFVDYVGSGCAGSGTLLQAMTAASTPHLGNFLFGFDVPRAPAGTSVLLFATASLAVVPEFLDSGCRIYLSGPELLAQVGTNTFPFASAVAGPTGGAFLAAPVPFDPTLVGTTWTFQAFVADLGTPLGFSATNAARTTIN